MPSEIFFADFDGTGPGFKGVSAQNEDKTEAVFYNWSIGGEPISAGRWQLSYPEHNGPNLTTGTGRYASIHASESTPFVDTHVWMISPLIDVRKYKNLVLSADIYFKAQGASAGEDILTVSMQSILNKLISADPVEYHTVEIIGQDMKDGDPELKGTKSWNLSPFVNKCH
ncbi:MAG: hypothetical protein P8X42_17825, partial [Calditrichaceae bacterium]